MPQPLDLSKFHDLSALRDQDRVKVSMDGAVLAEYKDPQPLSGPLNCRFGFGSKGTHTFRELKIRAVPLAAEAAKALAEMPLRPAATVPPRRNTRRLFAITGRGICSSGDWLCTQPQHLHPIYNAVVLNGPNSAPSLFYKQPVSGDLAFEVVMEYAPRVYRPSSVKGPDFPLPYLRDGGGEAGFVMYVGLDSKRPDSKRIAEQGFPAGWEVCLPHRDGLIVISWFKGRCHASTPYYAPIGGSKYNVRLERRGDTLRLFFDGRAVLEAKQPENVPTGDYSTILGFHQDLEGVIVHSASAYLID
jgi:hypothetical protein